MLYNIYHSFVRMMCIEQWIYNNAFSHKMRNTRDVYHIKYNIYSCVSFINVCSRPLRLICALLLHIYSICSGSGLRVTTNDTNTTHTHTWSHINGNGYVMMMVAFTFFSYSSSFLAETSFSFQYVYITFMCVWVCVARLDMEKDDISFILYELPLCCVIYVDAIRLSSLRSRGIRFLFVYCLNANDPTEVCVRFPLAKYITEMCVSFAFRK